MSSTPRSPGRSSTTTSKLLTFFSPNGEDVDTNWCSHQPASILHEQVWYKNYEAMQFLIDRGIDMTIRDYQCNATAEGWARVAGKDDKLGRFLQDTQQVLEQSRPSD